MACRHVGYRVRQFLRGWTARIGDDERLLVAQSLSPAALALFLRMPADAQRHSVNVLNTLRGASAVPPDLATAALLHDVGKVAASDAGAYLGLWIRGPLVIVEALRPRLLRRLACSQPSPSVRYALYVHLEHPHIGAEWAREAGCDGLTCWLIEHHQDKHLGGYGEPWNVLARLQWADGQN